MRTSLLISFLLGAALLPAQDREFGSAVRTTLTQIRAEPEAYKGVKVVFPLQFASLGKLSNPFFTKFTPADFANFYAWAEEQPLWRQEAYEDLFGTLFYPKLGPKLEQLYQLRVYQRLQVTGVIRNTFQNQPWIEVTDFEVVPGQVDMAVLTHVYRGEQMMKERRWQRAIAELTLAPGEGVPETVLHAVHKNLGICYLRIGEIARAAAHLQAAAATCTEPDVEVERLIAVAAARPAQELDRSVNQSGLKDYERPMWEAFDGDAAARVDRPPLRKAN
ncbi:MAG TPA: hypothetical protein VK348_10515 [Planctomycetota bacterium]|nr:hypothetical protein [Planctomycetota bacterium]